MRTHESGTVDELLGYLFDDQPHIFAEAMRRWLTSSRRFTAFASTFRDKIRKKVRVTEDAETLQDLRLELETAYLLLQERVFSLSYEPPCGQGRCPDFAVTFTTSMTFTVEVTRLRAVQPAPVPAENGSSAEMERLADAICSKLSQLLPQRSNIIIVGLDVPGLPRSDPQATLLRIQQRAERDENGFWQRYRFRDRADFFRHYQRLSEVLLRPSQILAGEPAVSGANPQAKHPLPARVRTALHRSHAAKA